MQNSEQLKNFIHKLHPLPERSFNHLIDAMDKVAFEKGKLVTRKGEIEQFFYIVLKGYKRAYFVKDDSEHTVGFSRP
ncbi:MAG: hypothetical protein R3281_09610 [Balneolaceae bacterium]|nr:hypothetical protein [Balneolaceae bacterium]